MGVEPATSRLRVMQNAAVLPDILVHLRDARRRLKDEEDRLSYIENIRSTRPS